MIQPLLCWPQDEALNDAELNAFQVRCFNAPLQPEELLGVKKVVQDKMPQVSGLTPVQPPVEPNESKQKHWKPLRDRALPTLLSTTMLLPGTLWMSWT